MSFDLLGDVNWLAVVVATLVYFGLGGLWFAPPTFGKAWMQASGIKMPEGKAAAHFYWGPLLATLVATVATALLAQATGAETLGEAIVLGLVVAVGYVATTAALSGLFDQRPRPGTWFAIITSYHVVGLVIVSAIVTLWT